MARILTVDDEVGILQLLKTLLENDGFESVQANNGNDAIALLEDPKEQIDLMISDIRMNPVNGMEVLKRGIAARPKLPVIMVTAFHSEAVSDEATHLGAVAYIPKPFEFHELLAAVHNAVDKK